MTCTFFFFFQFLFWQEGNYLNGRQQNGKIINILRLHSRPPNLVLVATFWFSFLGFVFAHAFIRLCVVKIITLQIKTKTTEVISHWCRSGKQHKGDAALLAVHKATRHGWWRWNVRTCWVRVSISCWSTAVCPRGLITSTHFECVDEETQVFCLGGASWHFTRPSLAEISIDCLTSCYWQTPSNWRSACMCVRVSVCACAQAAARCFPD